MKAKLKNKLRITLDNEEEIYEFKDFIQEQDERTKIGFNAKTITDERANLLRKLKKIVESLE
jgi:hypothetical protein